MGRLFNKIVRAIIKKMDRDHNELRQDTNEGGAKIYKVSDEIKECCLEAASSGAILLKNENNVLPIKEGEEIAVFGRTAFDYFDVGYGSGGDVSKPYSINLIEGLKEENVKLNSTLLNIYENWRKKPNNVVDPGFWGHWPFSYKEMVLKDDVVNEASKTAKTAIIVIGRAAGEDRECLLKEGSYYLSKLEKAMIEKVTKIFTHTVLVLDIGNIMDFSFINDYKIDAILLPFQGGMESGRAVAQVLNGRVNPSGRLTSTIAKNYHNYPSSNDFGGRDSNNYTEDIFVGYRYFETFKKDEVLYPFGYGLSYTTFEKSLDHVEVTNFSFKFYIQVKNTGKVRGKDTVQIYLHEYMGKISKPEIILVGFNKSEIIEPGMNEIVMIEVNLEDFASFDDSGISGHRYSYLLEAGVYHFFLGKNSRDLTDLYSITYHNDKIVKTVNSAMAPSSSCPFKRILNENGKIAYEMVPTITYDLKERILKNLPKEIPLGKDEGHTLMDVKKGFISLDQFISELTVEDLARLTMGEGGMGSRLGTIGNGGALGGVNERLRNKGIPPYIVSDGPSGLRVKITSSLLPSGTLLASTFDLKLIEKLYSFVHLESMERGVNCLLGPGMNIQRNPLCGRNFEYYSEDPLLSGLMAASVTRGLGKDGYSCTPKHFALNNQETNRNYNDSRVSEKALREIYLRNFEYAIKYGNVTNIMTSYNMVNGIYSHNNYDLTETILREEWGYKGSVITDWWMRYKTSPEFPNVSGNAYRVRSRCDVLMPGAVTQIKPTEFGNSLLENYGKEDGITLGEIERCAKDVLNMILNSSLMDIK